MRALSPQATLDRGYALVMTPDGVLVRANGADDWAIGEIDLAALDAFKRDAQVANANDWMAQLRPPVVNAIVETL